MSSDLALQSGHADAILQGAGDGIVLTDERGLILGLNPAGEEIFGFAASAVVGRHISTLIPMTTGGHLGEFLSWARAKGETPSTREVEGRRQTGEVFPLDVSVSHVDSAAKDSYVGVFRDISERKEAELRTQDLVEALKKSNEALKQSNEELESIAYIASHDLKAPLRGIDNLASWIEEDLGDTLEGEPRENMALLRNRILRLEHLLEGLLQYSRIGRKQAAIEMVDTAEEVRNLFDLLHAESFTLELGDGLPTFETARTPFEQIMGNLLSNAVKHHDKGRGTIAVTVEDQTDSYLFRVADDGPGIPPEYHERALRLFQTLRPRDDVEGSGMGLAIVKKTIEQQGGSIRIESDGTRGTTFRFDWPKVWQFGGNET